jgi:trigger factor
MAEVVQEAVNETSREALTQREEQPAFQPKIALPEDEAEINKIFEGSSDLAYTMSFEVLPKFQIMDLKTLKLERPVSDVADDDITKSLERLAATNLRYTTKDGAAASGDRVTIDFVGKIGDEAFEGGTTEGAQVVLGSSRFIPGFEEGLTGTKSGEERAIDANFPDDYPEARLAGKTARFEVKVKEVASPETPTIDDEFAKSVGIESLEQLRAAVKTRLEQDRAVASRTKLKRGLLDVLNEGHDFELPPTLVDNEFNAIWSQFTHDLEHHKRSFEDEGTTEEKARADYRDIATRRVRLGLVLTEIGRNQKIEVTDDEVNRALLERIRQFPGQERKVYDFYRSNPRMLAELRAPIYEDKVVDYITELAKVTDKKVTAEELYTDPDGDGHHHDHPGHDHDHNHDHHDHDHNHDHAHHDHKHG